MKERFLLRVQQAIREEMARAVNEVVPARGCLAGDDIDALQETTDAAATLMRHARRLALSPLPASSSIPVQ